MSDPAVAVEGVTRRYGETTALSGVSLSVDEGEVFGLLGPNGAGKTTLVRAITGTTRVDGGTVRVFGRPPREVERSRLGVLPQAFAPPERLTARELLRYYAGLYDEALPVDEALSAVGMADDADTLYENLSGGQQRRVCLGIALVNDPDLLVLDEPTTGIDPAGRRQVRERVADLAAGGATVLLTTHDIDETERLVDRVAMLAAGEVVATGSPTELVREHGGESRLVVETDADPAAVGGGYAVEPTDRGLVFPGVDPPGIGDVVESLDARGVEYAALLWARPGLEDVYLRLTGEGEDVPATPSGDLNRLAADRGGSRSGSRSGQATRSAPDGAEKGSTEPKAEPGADSATTGGDRP